MADDIELNAGSGGSTLATDEVSAKHYQLIKMAFGALNTATLVTSSVGFPVDIVTLAAPLNVVGGGTEAAALRVTIASDSTGVLTVDGTITEANSATIAGDTTSLDTKVPTIPLGGGTEAAAVRVTMANDSTGVMTIDGTVTETNSGTIAGDTTSIDGKVPTIPTGGGTEAAAVRVTVATDSTGVLTVDGTVAVSSIVLPDELQGPASPSIDSYDTIAISESAGANSVLVAAPGANKQIWVYGFVGTADTGDGTVSLQDEDDATLSGVMAVAENGGWSVSPSGNFAMPYIQVPTNKALEIDLVTCGFKGTLGYAIVSV